MRVVVSGGTGVIGGAAVSALLAAGHRVEVLCRSARNRALVEARGARPVDGDLFDVETLVPAFEGADAVVNLASRVPVGYAAALSRSWRTHDRLRTDGVANVVAAARRAGVRRVIQESVSLLYADLGDQWITEGSPVEITAANEPAAVAESLVQDFADGSHVGVVLRFGVIVGRDAQTQFLLRAAGNGRPVGFGQPGQWTHLVHTDDLGPAVAAALCAPSGTYNVGAAPVRQEQLVGAYAQAAGVDQAGFAGPLLRWLAGTRAEPLNRSLRVSSDRFVSCAGWVPARPVLDVSWFDAALSDAEGVGAATA